MEGSAKVIPATLDLLDLPSWKPGAGGQLLGKLREMEGLVAVLGAFNGEGDPAAQAEELLLELIFSDQEMLARRSERLQKEATAEPALRASAETIKEAVDHLEHGRPLRTAPWTHEQMASFKDSTPLTLKPMIWVVNHSESATDVEDLITKVTANVPRGDVVFGVTARLEEEASQLDATSRAQAYEELGMGAGALATMVKVAYGVLGLLSFYTIGPKESRAWTVPKGSTAAQAAGKIHTDLERGFIRAEVAPIDRVLEAGGWEGAKRSGFVRVEGRTYPVAEGDVVYVRFSV